MIVLLLPSPGELDHQTRSAGQPLAGISPRSRSLVLVRKSSTSQYRGLGCFSVVGVLSSFRDVGTESLVSRNSGQLRFLAQLTAGGTMYGGATNKALHLLPMTI